MKIHTLQNQLRQFEGVEVKLYDKWIDKLTDFDILHVFKDTIEPATLISYAKNKGLKIVISSVIPQENQRKIRASLFVKRFFPVNNTYSYLKNNLQLADWILPETEKEARFLSEVYGIDKGKMIVIPNGVNQAILDDYDASIRKDIILCVGRFDHNKNQHTLIEAVNRTNYELHLVGGPAIDDPTYYSYCESLCIDNPRIVFHGWLPHKSNELMALYKRARVVALVSHKEIFGNSLIEGGACGANLLATDVLPTDEWGLDAHCVKTPVNRWQDILPNLDIAWNTPISSTLHDIVKETFSWQNIARRHLEVYEDLL